MSSARDFFAMKSAEGIELIGKQGPYDHAGVLYIAVRG